MRRYRVTPAARDDLKRISRLIAIDNQSPQGAKRLRERFRDTSKCKQDSNEKAQKSTKRI
jgi:plasmid stabilization system protein ParE